MKKTDLNKILRALQTLEPRVTVPEEIAGKARRSIERMLAVKV
jgi:quinolinate synthase